MHRLSNAPPLPLKLVNFCSLNLTSVQQVQRKLQQVGKLACGRHAAQPHRNHAHPCALQLQRDGTDRRCVSAVFQKFKPSLAALQRLPAAWQGGPT